MNKTMQVVKSGKNFILRIEEPVLDTSGSTPQLSSRETFILIDRNDKMYKTVKKQYKTTTSRIGKLAERFFENGYAFFDLIDTYDYFRSEGYTPDGAIEEASLEVSKYYERLPRLAHKLFEIIVEK